MHWRWTEESLLVDKEVRENGGFIPLDAPQAVLQRAVIYSYDAVRFVCRRL